MLLNRQTFSFLTLKTWTKVAVHAADCIVSAGGKTFSVCPGWSRFYALCQSFYPISRTLLRRMRSSFTSCGLKEKAASMFVERFVMSFSMSLSISLPLCFWKGLCTKACLCLCLCQYMYLLLCLYVCGKVVLCFCLFLCVSVCGNVCHPRMEDIARIHCLWQRHKQSLCHHLCLFRCANISWTRLVHWPILFCSED